MADSYSNPGSSDISVSDGDHPGPRQGGQRRQWRARGGSYIYLHRESRVLICLACKAGIAPGTGLASHCRKKHRMKGPELEQAVQLAAEAAVATAGAGGLVKPEDAELPANGSTAIQQLEVEAGYSCTGCSLLSTSKVRMRQHWTDGAHGSGRQPSYASVRLQSFSSAKHQKRYWTVRAAEQGSDSDSGENRDDNDSSDGNEDDNNSSDENEDDNEDDEWERELAEYEAALAAEEAEQRRKVDGRTGVDIESPWVRKMGWAVHLADKDIPDLRQASEVGLSVQALAKKLQRAPKEQVEQERQFTRLGCSFDREVARCGRRISQVPTDSLCWLVGRDPSRPAARPFEMKQETRTTERYKGYWKQYLCYCVRACRLGRTEAESQRGIQFTADQWQALEAVVEALDSSGDDDPEADAYLDAAVFTFCIVSLKQKVAVQEYANPLLHFTAVLAISPVRIGWKTPSDFTTLLAGVAWCSRVLLLEHLYEHIPIREEGDAVRPGEDIEAEDIEEFMAGYRRWIADGSYSPFSTINRFMTIGKGFRQKEGGTARIMWEDGKQAVRYLGQRIEIREFRSMAQALVTEAEGAFDSLVYGRGQELLDCIELGRISDSMMFEGDGSSFVTNPENLWLQPGHRRVGTLTRPQLRSQRGGWHQRKTQGWLSGLQQLKGQLLLLTHVWGGQPGRGPEITTVRHCDTQMLVRNVFVYDGQVMLVTDRDKAKAIRGYGRKVARFLPSRVGKLLVAYVSWLIPFEAMLYVRTKAARGPSSSLSEWLWKDASKGRWGTEELTKGLQAATGEHIGVELGTAAYRHVAIELGRTIQGLIVQQQQLEVGAPDDGGYGSEDDAVDERTGEQRRQERTELIWDLQATHSSAIARSHYAVNIQFPGQLQPQMIANYREISRLWHQYLSWEDSEGDDQAIPHIKTPRKSGEYLGQNPTHPASTAQSGPSSTPNSVTELTTKSTTTDLAASCSCKHCYYHRGSGSSSSSSKKKRSQPDDRGEGDGRPARGSSQGRKRVRTTNNNNNNDNDGVKQRPVQAPAAAPQIASSDVDRRIQLGLEAILGKGASWRTAEQQQAMQQIMEMRGGSVLIVVLPTGGGKSLLFMIPAVPAVQGGVSVVVVPFVALMDDLVSRAQEAGLNCVRWRSAEEEGRDSNIPVRVASLVVVSADQASTHEFSAYADSLRERRLLRRIFVDECHTIIMDASYREKLRRLKGLYRYDCPVVLLTATLPVKLEGWFRQQMVARDAGIIRAATAKKNIRYSVVEAATTTTTTTTVAAAAPAQGGRSSLARTTAGRRPLPQSGGGKSRRQVVEDEVVQLINARTASGRLSGDQKGVVYCRSKKDSEQLAARIGCAYYHSSMEAAAREQALSSWAKGESPSRWITATTGLGTGIDIPGITVVIHAEQPYGLVDYIQQTGRGGRRAGEAVESIIVVAEAGAGARAGSRASADEDEAERANRLGIEAFIRTQSCRRRILGQFMDGAAADDCSSLGAVPCDRCKRGPEVEGEPAADRDSGLIPERQLKAVGRGKESRREATNGDSGQIPERQLKAVERGKESRSEMSDKYSGLRREILPTIRRRNRLKEEQKQQERRRRGLRQWLLSVEGEETCSVCYIQWQLGGQQAEEQRQYKHRLEECSVVPKGEYISWRQELSLGTGTCCWRCGLGMEWCEKRAVEAEGGEGVEEQLQVAAGEEESAGEDWLGLAGREREKGKQKQWMECRWNDKVWPVLLYIEGEPELWRMVESSVGEIGEEVEWREWIGRQRMVLGEKMTNGLAAIEAVVRLVSIGNKTAEEYSTRSTQG